MKKVKRRRRRVSKKKYLYRDDSSDSFFNYGHDRSYKKYYDYLSQDEDYDYEGRAEGLLRPISKRDLYEAFNSYRLLVGEEE